MKEECKRTLKELTGKKNIYFMRRGNSAIKKALKYARERYNLLYMQDQGGWITYPQIAKKLKFELKEIRTEYGYIDNLNAEGVALINSMAGYHSLIPMENITANLLINDVSGSIGTEKAKYGDIIIGSFGRWKPINIGKGGFIATDLEAFEEDYEEDYFPELHEKLKNLDERLEYFRKKKEKVMKDLKGHELINRNGINVIVKFSDEEERKRLINYCKNEGLEYTECPRYIRADCKGISVEIKR
ncbi:MAG: hypothetical protein ACQEP1_03480 [Nanobdellota archaeon]